MLRNKMKRRDNLLPLLMLLSLWMMAQGCKNISENATSDFYDLDNRGLRENLEYVFNPCIPSGKYDVFLEIRYNNNFSLESLPLNMEYFSVSLDSIVYDSMNINFIKNNEIIPQSGEGESQSKGNFGIYELKTLILKGFEIGDDSYITLSTPIEDTHGVISLGLTYKAYNFKTSLP